MTSEQDRRDEEQEHDEEPQTGDDSGFVLEDWEELDDVLAEVETRTSGIHPGLRREPGPVEDEEPEVTPEDLLFEAPHGRRPKPDRFTETDGDAWAGNDQDPESIGIPVHRDAEEVELELDEEEEGAIELEESGFFESFSDEDSNTVEAIAVEEPATEWASDELGEWDESTSNEDAAGDLAGEPAEGMLEGGEDQDFEEIILEDDEPMMAADLGFTADDPGMEAAAEELAVAALADHASEQASDDQPWEPAAADAELAGRAPAASDAEEVLADSIAAWASAPVESIEHAGDAEPETPATRQADTASDDDWAAEGVDAGVPGLFSVDPAVGEEAATDGGWADAEEEPAAAAPAADTFGMGRTGFGGFEAPGYSEVEPDDDQTEAAAFHAGDDYGQVEFDTPTAVGDVGALADAFDDQDADEQEYLEDESDDDPIYGQRDDLRPEEQIAWAPNPEAVAQAEFDDNYVDAAPQPVAVMRTGAVRRRRLPLRAAATAGAICLVAASIAVAVLFPDLLGMQAKPTLIDRTDVARPTLALDLTPPPETLPAVAFGIDLSVGQPVVPDLPPEDAKPPIDTPEVAENPTTDDPGAVDPNATPTTDPVVATQPGDSSMQPEPPVIDPMVAVGEELKVGTETDETQGAYHVHPMAANLVVGDQAFAQLVNGNYFVGTLKRVGPVQFTMRLEHGELTLPFDLLRAMGTLQSPEYLALRRAAPGAVRLVNSNRLVGSISRSQDGSAVTVEIESNRVLIPAEEIEDISEAEPSHVQIGADVDDQWVRDLIERRLREQEHGTPDAQPPGTPPPQGH